MAEEINESPAQSIKGTTGTSDIDLDIGNRFQTSSILNRICNFLGKGSSVEATAIGADLALSLMFEYFHFDRRQIEYLTPFIIRCFNIA